MIDEFELIRAWWDFMCKECIADRVEYTEEEQAGLIDEFLNELK